MPFDAHMCGCATRKPGKGGYVPSDLTYREWKNIYVDKKSTFEDWKAKHVDKSGESGIMKAESGSVNLENQRYGRNKSTLVNKTYINGGEYKRKFDVATESKEVNKTLYDCAKSALKHRSGTAYEDMYWVDLDSGKILYSVVDSKEERAIAYTDDIKNALQRMKGHNVVTLHTHPSSFPPSVSDLNSCYHNGYSIGFVACHNGKVFGYSSQEEINERLYNMYIQSFVQDLYSEYDAQIKTLEKLSRTYKVKVWEVLNDG